MSQFEHRLKQDTFKQRAQHLREEKMQLQKKKDGGEDMQKYEILYKKEKEINEYLEKFEIE